MAMFDTVHSNRIKLDDTHQLTCTIEAAQNVQGYTLYILKVQRGPSFESSWQISRRYSDFDVLNNHLTISGLELPLPPKKVFGKLEREFVAERQQGLQNYINHILSHPILSSSLYVKQFFDTDSYSFNFTETSLQHVSMVFRSETRWEIVEPLPEIGWRIRKQYFLVKSKIDPKCLSVLSWASFGPDKCLDDKDLSASVKLLGSLKHPFIYSPTFSCASDKGCLVIYDFLEKGSLKDLLCKAKPESQYLKKYACPKSHAIVAHDKIQLYGRHILLALKFLHERGLHHGHLHTGNVILSNGTCKISELTNSVLGIPSLLRSYFLQLKKVQTMESIDVYCFGHVIYEMAFGVPVNQCCCDNFPPNCPPELRSVFEAVLTTEACKKGLPSVSDLLMHPFFMKVAGQPEEKIHFKAPSQLRESMKKTRDAIELRLKEEQKMIRRCHRISRVHAQLTEDEKKKRLNDRKKQRAQKQLQDVTENGVSSSPTPSDTNNNRDASERSVNSSATVSPVSPPPPPPPLPGTAPPPPPPPPMFQAPENDRSALLNSIQGFNKNHLKKAETKDKSLPKM